MFCRPSLPGDKNMFENGVEQANQMIQASKMTIMFRLRLV